MAYTIDTMVTPGAGWVLVDDPADCRVTVQVHTDKPWFIALHEDVSYLPNSEGFEIRPDKVNERSLFEFEIGTAGIGVYVKIPADGVNTPVRVTSLGIDL